ncbi:MAG: pyridoxal 5'-phosphate synthase glutaminase subunit PdxT [Candidatus Thermoplasmatota archaeon]
MVKRNIGIVGIQGAISEHKEILKQVFQKNDLSGNIQIVKKKEEIEKLDGLIIPGGESTTISRFLHKNHLDEIIRGKIDNKTLSVMGTCAGCVILGKQLIDKDKDDVKLLNAMDIKVKRNAFGRQKESFEQSIKIKSFKEPFKAVFIRAPVIAETDENVEILAETQNHIVMVKQNNMLAMSFHPELTTDTRIHEYFLKMIKK